MPKATIGGLILLTILLPAAPTAAGPLPIDPSFAADPVWDDGLAEVSTYDAERVIYGRARAHTATVIVVKEEFDDRLRVKADPPFEGRALTTVLKVNYAATIPTENYPYHYLGSFFLRRDDLRRLVKATVGSQEWCGNTFKEVLVRGGAPRIHAHSYFDGQGDSEQALPLGEDGLLDEQMLLAVRAAALPEGSSARLSVSDPILTSQAGPVTVSPATLTAGPLEETAGPAGRLRARRFDLRRADGTGASYWVADSPRRTLIRMEASDGRKLALRESRRRDYWSR